MALAICCSAWADSSPKRSPTRPEKLTNFSAHRCTHCVVGGVRDEGAPVCPSICAPPADTHRLLLLFQVLSLETVDAIQETSLHNIVVHTKAEVGGDVWW